MKEANESELHLSFISTTAQGYSYTKIYESSHFLYLYTLHNSSFITQGRMSVFCIEEASPSTYADIQPWQVYSKRRIKPYTEPHIPKIPTI